MVVPYTPGGITDVVTRIYAQELAKTFNQNILVDNRPGANNMLGAETVARASAEGYTLLGVIAARAANQTLYPGERMVASLSPGELKPGQITVVFLRICRASSLNYSLREKPSKPTQFS